MGDGEHHQVDEEPDPVTASQQASVDTMERDASHAGIHQLASRSVMTGPVAQQAC
jgi:hypothetical protein